MHNRRTQRRGIIALWLALMLLILVGIAGVVADTGYLWISQQRLQSAADAAALAGAQVVRQGEAEAIAAAKGFAERNVAAGLPVRLATEDITLGRYDRLEREFIPNASAPNAVRVIARRVEGSEDGPVPMTFGRIFGVNSADVRVQAIAMVGGGTGSGVIALDCESDPEFGCRESTRSNREALDIRGNTILNVEEGAIISNSAIDVRGNARFVSPSDFWSMDGISVSGNYVPEGEHYYLDGCMPDPIAPWVDEVGRPDYDDWSDLGTIDGESDYYEAGYYSGGIDLGQDNVTLGPGVYVLDGAGLSVAAQATLNAEAGAMFYIVGDGSVDIESGSNVFLRPMDSGTIYDGMTIWQDTPHESGISSKSENIIEGTLYFPCSELVVTGSGDAFGNQLVAWRLTIDGDGEVKIVYDGQDEAIGTTVFLVR